MQPILKLEQHLKYTVIYSSGIHCIAHNLQLACQDTFKAEALVAEIKDMLDALHKHYKYSAKALCELKEIANIMEEKVARPTDAIGARWVAHLDRALNALLTNYPVIHVHMQNCAAAKNASKDMVGRATKLCKQLENHKNVGFMYFLAVFEVIIIFDRNGLVHTVVFGFHYILKFQSDSS